MAYDETLAARIRQHIAPNAGLSEKKMFGGLAFLINGRMTIAASGHGGLLVRVDPADTETLIANTHAELMEMRGRKMNGWLRVATDDVKSDAELLQWIERSLTYAQTLPPKTK